MKLKHEFVEFIPDQLDDGTIYISIHYATASHKCPCGCGNEIVTPLTPTDWTLLFDGVSIALDPSIGNWSFDCKSHYWIKKNRIIWAKKWSNEMIELNRKCDSQMKQNYYNETKNEEIEQIKSLQVSKKSSWLDKVWSIFK